MSPACYALRIETVTHGQRRNWTAETLLTRVEIATDIRIWESFRPPRQPGKHLRHPARPAGFDYGRVVTFTATAGPGSTFSGWIDDGGRIGGALSDPATGAALPSSGTISVTMTTSRAITATFSAQTPAPSPTPVPTPDPTPDPDPSPDPGPAPGPPDPTVVDRLYLPAVAKP